MIGTTRDDRLGKAWICGGSAALVPAASAEVDAAKAKGTAAAPLAAEMAARAVLSLPIYPEMTARQVEQVVAAMEQEAYVG